VHYILIALAFASGGLVRADTVSYSNPIPASDAAGHSSLPTTAPFSLPEFNPALGTLVSVHLDFDLNYQGELDIFNFSGSTQSFTNASSSVPITISAPSSGVPSLSASYSVSSGSLVSSPPLNQFLGPVLNTTIPFDALSADFASYEGIGNNSYLLAYLSGTYGGSTAAPGGTVFFGGDANSLGTASVLYTYSAVPEPDTLVLFGIGALGLLACGLARRRSAASPAQD